MRTIRMTVAYDGTDFAGFQAQNGQRTVQETLEGAVCQITGAATRVAGAGRTDAGVHARGQVISFRTTSPLGPLALRRATNAVLPPDVVVVDAADAPADFHARFSARARSYRYTIWNAPERAVADRRLVYHWRSYLDDEAMDRAAQGLVGRHDFAAFSGSLRGRERPTTTIRTVFRLQCWRDRHTVLIDAIADAFLPRMVRNIVGSLLSAGMRPVSADEVAAILAGRDRRLAGATAPAHGLCLTGVWYD